MGAGRWEGEPQREAETADKDAHRVRWSRKAETEVERKREGEPETQKVRDREIEGDRGEEMEIQTDQKSGGQGEREMRKRGKKLTDKDRHTEAPRGRVPEDQERKGRG